MLRPWLFTLPSAVLLLVIAYYLPPLLRAGDPVYQHRELPAAVASDLRARGCNIVAGHGVVSGNFTGSAARDWAVLCQIGDQASLLIYTAGREKATVLNTHPGGLDPKQPEAVRTIRGVDWNYVARHNPELRLSRKPKACVEDALGMGSVLYCYLDGKWVDLMGAD